jgi:3-oxoacyl-[acyl-carrier-protein] synthase II
VVPVSITARGVVSAWGAGEQALWRGLLSGESRVLPAAAADLPPMARAATVPDAALDPGAAGRDRTLAMVREAARQLRHSPAWSAVDPAALGVCVGTTQGAVQRWQAHQRRLAADPAHQPPAPELSDPAREVAAALGARGPVECPSMACASGTAAIGLGLGWIRDGLCSAVVAGGADGLSGFVYHGFASLRALDPHLPRPFDRRRAGLGLGEGAALVLLQAGAGPPGAPRVAGFGLAADANHLTGPDPEGQGVQRALAAALADAGLQPHEVDLVNAHGTATRYNDRMEGLAFARLFGPGAVPVNSIKGALGHAMGAAGAIEAITCCLVLERGLAPPTANLRHPDPELSLDLIYGAPRPGGYRRVISTSSGFGGINASLVFVAQ